MRPIRIGLVVCFCGVVAAQDTGKPQFIIFDPPGSAQTYPQSVNASGLVAGFYYDGTADYYSFLRRPSGQFVTFGVTGAIATYAYSVNDAGTVTGYSQPPTY